MKPKFIAGLLCLAFLSFIIVFVFVFPLRPKAFNSETFECSSVLLSVYDSVAQSIGDSISSADDFVRYDDLQQARMDSFMIRHKFIVDSMRADVLAKINNSPKTELSDSLLYPDNLSLAADYLSMYAMDVCTDINEFVVWASKMRFVSDVHLADERLENVSVTLDSCGFVVPIFILRSTVLFPGMY